MIEVDRSKLLGWVRGALEPLPQVRALLEGGSAAFGRVDEYSDIDLVADVEDGAGDVVFSALEAALAREVPVEHRWVVPEPAWHGMSQRFYRFAGAPPWLVLDISLRPLSRRTTFTEVECHGTPLIIFDKDALAKVSHVDPQELAQRARARIEALSEQIPFTAMLAEKELRRGHLPDALGFYGSFLLQPLVEALRLRHATARHAFGSRYLAADLPPDVAARVTELMFVRDRADLEVKIGAARAWLEAEIAALRAR